MSHFFSERAGLRPSLTPTYEISRESYEYLFNVCENFFPALAWKFSDNSCPDNPSCCCGTDRRKLIAALKIEIPELYNVKDDDLYAPPQYARYNQWALLDFIEFIAQNCRSYTQDYHVHFKHHHLLFNPTTAAKFYEFQSQINEAFSKTGLLYRLNDDKQVERVVLHSPLTPELQENILTFQEPGVRETLEEALRFHRSRDPQGARNAAQKIWDAFERLKTYYCSRNLTSPPAKDKKTSYTQLIAQITLNSDPEFQQLFNDEFNALTDIGNKFTIRHSETTQIEPPDARYYDYFFNRCLSLIAFVIQRLPSSRCLSND